MEKVTKKSSKNKILKWLRIIHRDLGYFMVGASLIYAISGLFLNHLNGKDPAFKTKNYSFTTDKLLSTESFKTFWAEKENLPTLNRVSTNNDSTLNLLFAGGTGSYDPKTGEVNYQTRTKNHFVFWINKLHYNNIKGWYWIGDIFAGSLIFFALSGLVMVRGKNGFKRRGVWFVLVGLLVPILYLLFG